jgi:hypothetical protein
MKKIIVLFYFTFFPLLYTYPEALPYKIPPGRYYMLDYPVNIRSDPNLNGSIIGRLVLDNEIEVINAVDTGDFWADVSSIDGALQYWYHIKFGTIYGYIFGGYIAMERVVFDIDNNGINDYFYYRYGAVWGWNHGEDASIFPADIFIYINNKRVLPQKYEEYWNGNPWLSCELSHYNISNGIKTLEIRILELDPGDALDRRETAVKTIKIEISN